MQDAPRYVRVGCPVAWVSANSLESNKRCAQNGRGSQDQFRLGHAINAAGLLVIQYWLLDEPYKAWIWGGRVLDLADEYVFGEWRDRVPTGRYHQDPPDRAYWDRIWSWEDEFIACLLGGSIVGAWDRLERYARWLREDVTLDIGQSKEHRAWLLLVAGVLKGRPWDQMSHWVDTIEQGRRKRERLLLASLRTLARGDQAEFTKAFDTYLRHYKGSESKRKDIPSKLAVDGTFLFHLAIHRGLTPPMPPGLEDRLIRLE